MSIEFRYGQRRVGNRFLSVPVVEAQVQLPVGFHPLRLLLDTGADCSMLPKSIGELIGLDFDHLPTISIRGIEGHGLRGYRSVVTLRIGNLILPPIPCIYVNSDSTPPLLGREGFFDLFNITFDNRRKRVVLAILF